MKIDIFDKPIYIDENRYGISKEEAEENIGKFNEIIEAYSKEETDAAIEEAKKDVALYVIGLAVLLGKANDN